MGAAMKRKPGRPHKVDPLRKKITIDQAVQMTEEFWSQYGKKGYSKQHIYNLISKGELNRESHSRCVLLFEDEVKQRLCG
jgi:hypothetical protein